MLLNACVEHIRQYGGRMGVFHMDYEVQYSLTTEYVDEMLSSNRDILDVYRCCVPFGCIHVPEILAALGPLCPLGQGDACGIPGYGSI